MRRPLRPCLELGYPWCWIDSRCVSLEHSSSRTKATPRLIPTTTPKTTQPKMAQESQIYHLPLPLLLRNLGPAARCRPSAIGTCCPPSPGPEGAVYAYCTARCSSKCLFVTMRHMPKLGKGCVAYHSCSATRHIAPGLCMPGSFEKPVSSMPICPPYESRRSSLGGEYIPATDQGKMETMYWGLTDVQRPAV